MGIRRAKITDVRRIKQLIDEHMQEGFLLPRPLNELYENVREFHVYEGEDGVVHGCAGLHIFWADLAEIKSLVVDHHGRGRGWGKLLIEACLQEARELQIARVFALTQIPGFFLKHNFQILDKTHFPHKVWSECIRCPKFQNCDEVAVGITIGEPVESPAEYSGPRGMPLPIIPPSDEPRST